MDASRERSSLAPLVVALLLAAFLIVGTGVGGLVAWRMFRTEPEVSQPMRVILVEEIPPPDHEEPKPGN